MDDELVLRAQSGDTEAFARLVDTYGNVAWRTARVILGDADLAEDAVQDAWLDAWRGLRGFQIHRAFRPWLLTLVVNRCRMVKRKVAAPTTRLTDELGALLRGPDDVAGEALRREADAEMRDALALLPADQARILELRFYAELDLAEISAVTGVPLGTVKSRLHRALTHLRVRLSTPITSVTNGELR